MLDYVKTDHPRVLFVGYGETDNWAHQGRYDLVLESAHGFDHFVQQLWETMQAMPEYCDQTTFILTTDHGRGSGLVEWKEHGVDEKGSENIWIAVMGPDTPARGERKKVERSRRRRLRRQLRQLGKDYPHDVAAAAKPLPDLW